MEKIKAQVIDTHAHLDDPAFDDDRGQVLRRAELKGVAAIINPGSSLKSSVAAVEYARKTPRVFAAVGLHPHEVPDQEVLSHQAATLPSSFKNLDQAMAEIEGLARDPAVVGIGEFGLDLKGDGTDLETQKKALVAQLKLANEQALPIILHCRAVYDDLEKILSKHQPKVPGVIHCFTGDTRQAKKLISLGLYIAVGGIITFKNNTEQLRRAVARLPLDRLLLETDAPYLSPEPYRGKRNEPARVTEIGQFIADLRQISYSELAAATTANARKVFALPDALTEE